MDLRRTKLLDAETGEPLAHVDALVQRLALDDAGNEATGKGVTVGEVLALVFTGFVGFGERTRRRLCR